MGRFEREDEAAASCLVLLIRVLLGFPNFAQIWHVSQNCEVHSHNDSAVSSAICERKIPGGSLTITNCNPNLVSCEKKADDYTCSTSERMLRHVT